MHDNDRSRLVRHAAAALSVVKDIYYDLPLSSANTKALMNKFQKLMAADGFGIGQVDFDIVPTNRGIVARFITWETRNEKVDCGMDELLVYDVRIGIGVICEASVSWLLPSDEADSAEV